MTNFISLKVRPAMIMHGFDAENHEIIENFPAQGYAEKLIAIERIQSVTEQYLLVTSSHGRMMYWEYEGDLASVSARLAAAGLLVA